MSNKRMLLYNKSIRYKKERIYEDKYKEDLKELISDKIYDDIDYELADALALPHLIKEDWV